MEVAQRGARDSQGQARGQVQAEDAGAPGPPAPAQEKVEREKARRRSRRCPRDLHRRGVLGRCSGAGSPPSAPWPGGDGHAQRQPHRPRAGGHRPRGENAQVVRQQLDDLNAQFQASAQLEGAAGAPALDTLSSAAEERHQHRDRRPGVDPWRVAADGAAEPCSKRSEEDRRLRGKSSSSSSSKSGVDRGRRTRRVRLPKGPGLAVRRRRPPMINPQRRPPEGRKWRSSPSPGPPCPEPRWIRLRPPPGFRGFHAGAFSRKSPPARGG